MKAGHLVCSIDRSVLVGDLRFLIDGSTVSSGCNVGVEVKLKSVDDLVLKLDDGAEFVRVVPRLGERETVLAVGVFGLADGEDDTGCVGMAIDLEGNTRGRRGLHLERGGADGVVLAQEIIGGLAKVLRDATDERVSSI